MADRLDPEARSRNMARISSQDTGPEMRVRRALHAAGYRFRLHSRDLPGTPDIVLPKWRTALFVHGCFWHRHPGCRNASMPGTRTDFWAAKFAATVERDSRKAAELTALGWHVAVIWECEATDAARIVETVRARLLPAVPAPVRRTRRRTSATAPAQA